MVGEEKQGMRLLEGDVVFSKRMPSGELSSAAYLFNPSRIEFAVAT